MSISEIDCQGSPIGSERFLFFFKFSLAPFQATQSIEAPFPPNFFAEVMRGRRSVFPSVKISLLSVCVTGSNSIEMYDATTRAAVNSGAERMCRKSRGTNAAFRSRR